MIRHAFAAAALLAAAPLATSPLQAQSTSQDELDARYDRALAAGYKALFLCSAIANAERNGTTRTPESVMAWELTGIQAPLDQIVAEMPFSVLRFAGQHVAHVQVDWSENMPPRYAKAQRDQGCRLAPVGQASPMLDSLTTERSKVVRTDTIEIAAPGAERLSLRQTKKLKSVFSSVFSGQYGSATRTTAVIIKRGAAFSEQYDKDFSPLIPQRTWSVAKSIAATLVGAAVQRGDTTTDRAAGLGLFVNDPRHAITIDHLLRMASGRYSDTPGNRTDPLYFGGSTVDETAAHWPLLHRPGTVFRYANNDTLMAVDAIADTFDAHPPAEFFAQVGMDHTVAETDWQGDYILSSQVWSTARDLAQLGQLYLNDGVLPSGERVLPEGWVEYVSAPSGPQPDGPFGYGAGFWLFDKSDGVPADTFAAMGNRGQYVVIVPSMNVVIVRRGEDPTGSRFDIAAFTRDVLESLEE